MKTKSKFQFPLARTRPLLVVMSLLLSASSLEAQPSIASDQGSEASEEFLSVYRLSNVTADDAMELLATFLADHDGSVMAQDARSNSIILKGTRETHMLVEKLLEEIDLEQPLADSQEDQDNAMIFYYLEHAPASEVAQMLQSLLAGSSSPTRLSVDKNRNAIILQTDREAHELASNLIKHLDSPGEDSEEAPDNQVVIELFWLAEAEPTVVEELSSAGVPVSFREVPDSLQDILGGKLAESFGQVEQARLFAKLRIVTMCTTEREVEFRAESVGVQTGRGSQSATMSVLGSIIRSEEASYQTRFILELDSYGVPSVLESTILMRPDHPVGLAVADTGLLNSLFIIRLTEVE